MLPPYRQNAAPPPKNSRPPSALDGAWRNFLWPPLVASVAGAIAIGVDRPVALTVALFIMATLGAVGGIGMLGLAGNVVTEPLLPPGGVPRVVSGGCLWIVLWTAQLLLALLAMAALGRLFRYVF